MKKMLRRIKRILKVAVGQDFFIKPDYHCFHQRFGSLYGGWNIVVDKLNEDSIVYSFGVGKDTSFDLALVQKYGCKIHAFDPTPESIKWVQEQNFPPDFILYNYGISASDGLVSFYPPKNHAYG